LLRKLAAPVPPEIRHDAYVAGKATAAARWLRSVPAAMPDDVFPGVDGLSLTMQHHFEPRGLPYGDAYVLSLITAAVEPEQIFEIGTGTGHGTLVMLRQAPGAHVDTLDLGAQEDASLGTAVGDRPIEAGVVGEAWRGTEYEPSVDQHFGDSATFDFSPFEGRNDLVFVDGAHTADYVEKDTRTALRLVKPGGTIVWDDCHLVHAGVSRTLVGFRKQGYPIQRMAASRLAVLRVPGAPSSP
jgi:predicted O-methyltransferase YrrM